MAVVMTTVKDALLLWCTLSLQPCAPAAVVTCSVMQHKESKEKWRWRAQVFVCTVHVHFFCNAEWIPLLFSYQHSLKWLILCSAEEIKPCSLADFIKACPWPLMFTQIDKSITKITVINVKKRSAFIIIKGELKYYLLSSTVVKHP